jgi:hypothetical protein
MTSFKYGIAAAGSLLLGGFAVLSPLSAATAADLNSRGCCSDLEQRVSELEATTARKGNTKVSLTVYGQVNRDLLFYDDGKKSDVLSEDNSTSSTRFGFKGDGKIIPGFKSGFNIELEVKAAASSGVGQSDYVGAAGANAGTTTSSSGIAVSKGAFNLRQANLYIEGEKYGRVTLGQQNGASKEGLTVNLSNSQADINNYFNSAFGIRTQKSTVGNGKNTGTFSGLTWGQLNGADSVNGNRVNAIRYDTPSLYGFILSAAWGENDYWDAAIRFSKDFGAVKVAAFGGYAYSTTECSTGSAPCATYAADAANTSIAGIYRTGKVERWQGAGSVMHTLSGLYGNIAGGQDHRDQSSKDATYIYGQLGLERKLMPLGKTTVYGEYGNYKDFAAGVSIGSTTAANAAAIDLGGLTVTGSNVDRWGLGAVQNFENAATDVYVTYQHYDATINTTGALSTATGNGRGGTLQEWDAVITGAKVKF